MTAITTRPYHRRDAPALARLFFRAVRRGAKRHYSLRQRKAWAPRLPNLDHWRKRLKGQTILIATRHDRAVGFLALRDDGMIDLAFVDPAFAPGVGTPEAGGPTAREALAILRAMTPMTIVGCDVVETNPGFDGPGQITALLAATVALELLSLIAVSR